MAEVGRTLGRERISGRINVTLPKPSGQIAELDAEFAAAAVVLETAVTEDDEPVEACRSCRHSR